VGLSGWVSEVDGDLDKEGISLAPGGHMRFVCCRSEDCFMDCAD